MGNAIMILKSLRIFLWIDYDNTKISLTFLLLLHKISVHKILVHSFDTKYLRKILVKRLPIIYTAVTNILHVENLW